jgi:hypothetical protein
MRRNAVHGAGGSDRRTDGGPRRYRKKPGLGLATATGPAGTAHACERTNVCDLDSGPTKPTLHSTASAAPLVLRPVRLSWTLDHRPDDVASASGRLLGLGQSVACAVLSSMRPWATATDLSPRPGDGDRSHRCLLLPAGRWLATSTASHHREERGVMVGAATYSMQ